MTFVNAASVLKTDLQRLKHHPDQEMTIMITV